MFPLYNDYIWKDGKPVGIEKAKGGRYRIVTDPYRKWITIEAYAEKGFEKIIYDSRFLDFRKLTPADQVAWRKQIIDAENAWIYNEDDRLILKECYVYEEGICKEVKILSPYGSLVGYYHMPEGPEGNVTLWDSNQHCVMRRVEEKWDMDSVHVPKEV